MKPHCCLCLCSLVTLLASTVAVMVVLGSVVVPHLRQQAHLNSVCRVTGIKEVVAGPGKAAGKKEDRVGQCVQVTVTFTDLNNRVSQGYLRYRGENGIDSKTGWDKEREEELPLYLPTSANEVMLRKQ